MEHSPMTKTLGIIGGMGPLASALFLRKVVESVTAGKDQDHPRIVMDSNPAIIPDRTAAVLGEGPSPAPGIIQTGRILIAAGADFLAMPCVTAHAFFDKIQSGLGKPVIHMLRETRALAERLWPGARPGLLGTEGTLKTGLFDNLFKPAEIILPDTQTQKELINLAIACVKGGDIESARPLILRAAQTLTEKGADLIIAGCTEVPLMLRSRDTSVPVLDPMDALARACVRHWHETDDRP